MNGIGRCLSYHDWIVEEFVSLVLGITNNVGVYMETNSERYDILGSSYSIWIITSSFLYFSLEIANKISCYKSRKI